MSDTYQLPHDAHEPALSFPDPGGDGAGREVRRVRFDPGALTPAPQPAPAPAPEPPAPAPTVRLAADEREVRRNMPFAGVVFAYSDDDEEPAYVAQYTRDEPGSLDALRQSGGGEYLIELETEGGVVSCEVSVRGSRRSSSRTGGRRPAPRMDADLEDSIRREEREHARGELDRETRRLNSKLDARDRDLEDAEQRVTREREETERQRKRAIEAEHRASQADLAVTKARTEHLAEIDRLTRGHQATEHRLQTQLDKKSRELKAAEHLARLAEDGIEVEDSVWDKLIGAVAGAAHNVDIGQVISSITAAATGAPQPVAAQLSPTPPSPAPTAIHETPTHLADADPGAAAPPADTMTPADGLLTLALAALAGDTDAPDPDVYASAVRANAAHVGTDEWREIAGALIEHAAEAQPDATLAATYLAPLAEMAAGPMIRAALQVPAKHALTMALSALGIEAPASATPYLTSVVAALQTALKG